MTLTFNDASLMGNVTREVLRHTAADVMPIPTNRCSSLLEYAHVVSLIDDFYAVSRSVDVIIMTSLLTLAAVAGTMGNALVILVCCRYPTGKSTQTFVLALAVSDLFVSSIIIPCRIITYHFLLPELACKVVEGAIYMASHMSFYLLTLIAVDRYFAICRPTASVLTRRRAKMLVACTVLLSAVCSTPAAVMAGKYVIRSDGDDVTGSTSSGVCFIGICNSDGSDHRYFSSHGVFVYSCLLAASIAVQWSTISILYIIVFCTLYRRFGMAGDAACKTTGGLRRADASLAAFGEPVSTAAQASELSRAGVLPEDGTNGDSRSNSNCNNCNDGSYRAHAATLSSLDAIADVDIGHSDGGGHVTADDNHMSLLSPPHSTVRKVPSSNCVRWDIADDTTVADDDDNEPEEHITEGHKGLSQGCNHSHTTMDNVSNAEVPLILRIRLLSMPNANLMCKDFAFKSDLDLTVFTSDIADFHELHSPSPSPYDSLNRQTLPMIFSRQASNVSARSVHLDNDGSCGMVATATIRPATPRNRSASVNNEHSSCDLASRDAEQAASPFSPVHAIRSKYATNHSAYRNRDLSILKSNNASANSFESASDLLRSLQRSTSKLGLKRSATSLRNTSIASALSGGSSSLQTYEDALNGGGIGKGVHGDLRYNKTQQLQQFRRRRTGSGQVSCGHTAKILLAVTLTAVALYIPFVVIKLHLLPNIITLRLIFFAASAANPIIYCVSSQQFRNNVRRLLRRFL